MQYLASILWIKFSKKHQSGRAVVKKFLNLCDNLGWLETRVHGTVHAKPIPFHNGRHSKVETISSKRMCQYVVSGRYIEIND